MTVGMLNRPGWKVRTRSAASTLHPGRGEAELWAISGIPSRQREVILAWAWRRWAQPPGQLPDSP